MVCTIVGWMLLFGSVLLFVSPVWLLVLRYLLFQTRLIDISPALLVTGAFVSLLLGVLCVAKGGQLARPKQFRVSRMRRETCSHCGYSLRGLPSAWCPECGHLN
jgi:hypothetical protein